MDVANNRYRLIAPSPARGHSCVQALAGMLSPNAAIRDECVRAAPGAWCEASHDQAMAVKAKDMGSLPGPRAFKSVEAP